MSKDNLRYYTYQLDMKVLNVLAIILFVMLVGLMYLIGYNFSKAYLEYGMIWILVLLVLWLILHEILHGIGFSIFKSVDKKNVVYGMALEKGVFYCMCKQKISKKVIFASLLFPVTIIGIITLILGIIIDNSLLVLLSLFNIIGSIGDIVMSVYFAMCPKDVVYLDLDDCTSFTVLSKKDLSKIKVPGIKLISDGDYDSKMKAKDRRKLVISKWSWIVMIIIFILILIEIIGGII